MIKHTISSCNRRHGGGSFSDLFAEVRYWWNKRYAPATYWTDTL